MQFPVIILHLFSFPPSLYFPLFTFSFLRFLGSLCAHTDLQPWQVRYQSSVRETGAVAVVEGHAPPGSPNLLHIQTPPRLPLCPCRPGTCVTYNWFINNVNRCFWSSLASHQFASILFYWHSLPHCISLNEHWHRMEEGDVFFEPSRRKTSFSNHSVKSWWNDTFTAQFCT